MDFELSDEHKLFRDTVHDFAQNEIAPGALERDKTHEFPHDIITKMAKLGLMGIPFPEDYGGAGGDTISYAGTGCASAISFSVPPNPMTGCCSGWRGTAPSWWTWCGTSARRQASSPWRWGSESSATPTPSSPVSISRSATPTGTIR